MKRCCPDVLFLSLRNIVSHIRPAELVDKIVGSAAYPYSCWLE